MERIKTKFNLWDASETKVVGQITIIGKKPNYIPYISMAATQKPAFLKMDDLEQFAVNILKALKSDKLK